MVSKCCLSFRLDDLTVNAFISTGFRLAERRANCICPASSVISTTFGGNVLRTTPGAVMHDLPQVDTCFFEVCRAGVGPERVRPHTFDDLGLLPHRIQVHLKSRETVHQVDLQIGECSGIAQNSELHPGN